MHLLNLLTQARPGALVKIFSPEHGLDGKAAPGIEVKDGAWQNIPVQSLYGKSRAPAISDWRGIDAVVCDLPDVGVRCFTYASTMLEVCQSAAAAGVRCIILDRINPLGGECIEGSILPIQLRSFVGPLPVPFRHGFTMAELMRFGSMSKEWYQFPEPEVIRIEGWKRSMLFPDTGLPWRAPSPNLRSWDACALYPALVLLEATNISEGRGTSEPFCQFGSPWIDQAKVMANLSERWSDRLDIREVSFTPHGDAAAMIKYDSQSCFGVHLTAKRTLDNYLCAFGFDLLAALLELYPDKLQLDRKWLAKLLGVPLRNAENFTDRIENAMNLQDLTIYMEMREAVLLY